MAQAASVATATSVNYVLNLRSYPECLVKSEITIIIIKYSRVNCISNHYFLQEKMGGKAGQWSVTIWTGEIPGLVM